MTTGLVGCAEPRLSTPPLAAALNRHNTLGHEAIAFATDMLGIELLPWQRFWLLHALELDGTGGFRYRTVLTLTARQSGKTTVLRIVALWMMYLGRVRMVLAAAQSLDMARESWQGAIDMAEGDPEMAREVALVRRQNGEQELRLTNGARYKITAANRGAGRGLSVDLLILDELREQRDWLAWSALSKTVMARPNALTVAFSNAGDDESVVLNNLRSAALAGTDPSLGLFEWSAPDDCELDDAQAWCQANPGLGHTVSEAGVRSALSTDPPAVFRTELLCQRVDSLDGAFDMGAWRAGADPSGSLAPVRDRVVLCVDVAPDCAHVTLAGAAVTDDGRVRGEVFGAWTSTSAARAELPGLLAQVDPAAVAWFPSGPAAALAADLRALGAVEIKGTEVGEACQELAELVEARQVLHPSDPLLDAHIAGASKLRSGDGWRLARRGAGHVDAAYALAGAVHVARTLPVAVPLPRSAVY